jgi:hypothetical protein
MKCLTAFSNPSLIGHSLITFHEKIGERVRQGTPLLYYRPTGEETSLKITYSWLSLSEKIETRTSAPLSYELSLYNNCLPAKYFEIALRAILGGTLALGAVLILLPIGYGLELIHSLFHKGERECSDTHL